MDLGLEGKIALVTGGTRGIGKAIFEKLKSEGVDVHYTGRSIGIDSTQEAMHIPVDILINNVGGGGTWGDENYTEFDEWTEVYKKNIGACVMQTNASLAHMIRSGWGRVITIASIYGKEAGGRPWFVSAKAAEIAYMKSMAHSNNYPNITFNTVSPGHIDTGKLDRKYEICGQPDDVANVVTFLCSDLAKHINGANIVVDGGESYSF